MSNLSDIGFPAKGDEEINSMIMSVLDHAIEQKCENGFYLRFSDPSGSELYLQGNHSHEMIGFNPHFNGKSRRKTALLHTIVRDTSELDGAYHAVADPSASDATQGSYDFIFDVPDFRLFRPDSMPCVTEVQLTAFGSNDFKLLTDEAALASNTPEGTWQPGRFIPPGLQDLLKDPSANMSQMRPVAKITGFVKEWELKVNQVNGNNFYWFLVETEGGEVDIVIDPVYVPQEPVVGNIMAGHFWLSGRITQG